MELLILTLQTRSDFSILYPNLIQAEAPPGEKTIQQFWSRYQSFYIYLKIATATSNIYKIQPNNQPRQFPLPFQL